MLLEECSMNIETFMNCPLLDVLSAADLVGKVAKAAPRSR